MKSGETVYVVEKNDEDILRGVHARVMSFDVENKLCILELKDDEVFVGNPEKVIANGASIVKEIDSALFETKPETKIETKTNS